MSEKFLKNLNEMEKHFANIIYDLKNEEAQICATNKYINDQLIENSEEIEEQNDIFLKLNAEYDDVKLTCDTMLKTINDKQIEIKKFETHLNDLENETNALQKEYEKIENSLIKTEKSMELCNEDKKIFELSRNKLELYKKMTNIVWDYSIPFSSSLTRGYIINKTHNYLNAFEFKKDEKCKEKLWKEIELGCGEDWSDIVAMTDVNK